MPTEENKAIARRFIQVWGSGELDLIDELAAPALTVHYPILPHVIRGGKTFKKLLHGFRSSFPDATLHVEEEIAEDDKVVIRWRFSGTHQGDFLNIPATGKKVQWTGITIYHIVDGKVAAEKGEEDFLGLLCQLGLDPRP
ncbi:MAG: ester cyclase [Deltaproteobacteria bacterium]|nr:ester cyclase [Candidatus Anaeroferrophillus wilburensis]MBN2890173.1 ester cyclase [Deltaproteobacteria bacterium]